MNIRAGLIPISQLFPHHPMPVSAKAITPPIPNAQYEPGSGRKGHRNQMQSSCLWNNPAHNIKYRKYCMKNKEENIKKPVPHKIGMSGLIKLIAITYQLCKDYFL
jgi:hypothetical protein